MIVKKCEAVNQNYSDVFTKDNGRLPNSYYRRPNNSLINVQITWDFIETAVEKLSVSDASGADNVSSAVVIFFQHIYTFLTLI